MSARGVEVRVEAKGGRAWAGNGDTVTEALANLLDVLEGERQVPVEAQETRRALHRMIVPWAGQSRQLGLVRRAVLQEARMVGSLVRELREAGKSMAETVQAVEAERPRIRVEATRAAAQEERELEATP